MKRIFIVFFIFAVLGGKALWTLQSNANRNYNRHIQWKSDTEEKPNYATCIGSDSDGSIYSYAKITIDVDRPFENIHDEFWKIQPNGVDYKARACIFADASTGSWTVAAVILGREDKLSGIVNGDTYRVVSKSDFDWYLGDPGKAENHIRKAFSTGIVNTPGFRSEAVAKDFGQTGKS